MDRPSEFCRRVIGPPEFRQGHARVVVGGSILRIKLDGRAEFIKRLREFAVGKVTDAPTLAGFAARHPASLRERGCWGLPEHKDRCRRS